MSALIFQEMYGFSAELFAGVGDKDLMCSTGTEVGKGNVNVSY